jgi:hypothetical protein
MLLAKRQILVNLGLEKVSMQALRMMLCSSLNDDPSSDHHNTCVGMDGITGKARLPKCANLCLCKYCNPESFQSA